MAGPSATPVPEAAPVAEACSICLLGAPRLVLPDGEMHLLQRHDAALLAMLAFDGPTLRSRAAALLWPHVDEKQARNNLRQRVFRLNRLAGQAIAVGEGGALRLAAGLGADVARPRRALALDPQACAGELLGGQEHGADAALADWVGGVRLAWRRTLLDVLSAEASRHESNGHVAAALPYAQRILAEDELLEHGHRRLIRLHYLRGDRSAALAASRRCREVLRRALDAEPDRETSQLIALVESSGSLPRTAVARRPMTALRPPRLIGRDAAWQRLERSHRQHGVGLIDGEPGIGKTRLLTEFASACDAAPIIGAFPGDALLPYALLGRVVRVLIQRFGAPRIDWVDAELRHVAPELGAANGLLQPLRLVQAATQALDDWRAAGLTLLVIDDLHCADAATLELLPGIAAVTSRSGLGWLLAYRGNDLSPPAATAVAAFEPRGLQRIALAPLDVRALEALLASLEIAGFDAPGWAPTFQLHTGGNPLYVLETLIALLEERPAALRAEAGRLPTPLPLDELIGRRLAQLSPPARQLARVAAVAGQDFAAGVAAAVLGRSVLEIADTWAELESARVIDADAFAHDLIREGVLRSLPQPVARALHGEVARVIDASGSAAPARVAHHWSAAGAWDRAAQSYLAAARQAFMASRLTEAAPWYERAADSFARSGQPDEQRRSLEELITCQIKRHDVAGARRIADELGPLARHADGRAWVHDRLGEIAAMVRDDPRALSTAHDMLAASPHSTNGWIAFNGTRKLAVALARLGRHEEGLALFETQNAWLAANPHEWNVHVWHVSHAVALELADRRGEAIAALDHAAGLARRHDNWYVVYAACRDRALARHWQGDVAAALLDAAEALRFADRLGDVNTRHNLRDAPRQAVLLRDAGRHAESLELLESSRAALAATESPFWLAYCEDQLALGYLDLGQTARALALVAAEPGCDNAEARATRSLVRARCMRAQGRRRLDDALPAALFQRPECPRRWRLLAELEASHALAPRQAHAACERVATEAAEHELDGIALHATMLSGAAALRADDATASETAVRAALALAQDGRRSPTGISIAAWWWLGARAFERLGLAAEAEALTTKAAQRLQIEELCHVPEPFKDSFLHRNPVHRELLASYRRLSQYA